MPGSLTRVMVVSIVVLTVVACGSTDSASSQADSSSTVNGVDTTAPTSCEASCVVELRPVLRCDPVASTAGLVRVAGGPPAPPSTDLSEQTLMPTVDSSETCVVGPPGAFGDVFAPESAMAEISEVGGWVVNTTLDPEDVEAWNLLASACFAGDITCPTRRLAIVLDGVIQSAPTVNQPAFPGSVQISGSFTEQQARDLAAAINAGK